ncbi:MAG: cation diffusion facilitator family transporter [Pseudomonadota bacterium]
MGSQNKGQRVFAGRHFRGWSPNFEQFQVFSLLADAVLVVPILYAAMISSSVGLVSSAILTLVDMAFSLLVYLSTRAANRSHALLFPHGTGKFEAIANGLLALSLLMSALGIIVLAVNQFLDPVRPTETTYGLLLLAAAFAVNGVIYVWSRGLEASGSVVVAVWRKTYLLELVMIAVTIIFVLFAGDLGGVFVYLDPLAALMIGVFTLHLAVRTLKDSVWELSDRALEEEVQLAILRGLSAQFDAFDALYDVRTRRTGGRPVIQIELGFDPDASWGEVQKKCADIRRQVEAEVQGAVVSIVPTAEPEAHVSEPR